MDESLGRQHFHTPLEESPDRSPASLLAARRSTPFRPRGSRKRFISVNERMALFNTVNARAFLMVVLFVELILIAIVAHIVLNESAWHFAQGRELHNPVYIAIPVTTLFIMLAMFGIGTNTMLLILPYLVIQVISNIMLAFAVGSISWYHFREFFTRKEFGVAIASFLLPLWLFSYITCVTCRVFISMASNIDQHASEAWKRKWSDIETAIDVEDDTIFDRSDARPESSKKKVRFLDVTPKKN